MGLASEFGDHSCLSNNSKITAIVFVVERDLSVRKSLEFLIRSAGLHPESFGSAQAFLVQPRVNVPSCLILDVAIPGPNVLELQKRIASEHSETPIIVVSSRADISTTVQAIKAGAVEFLTKPFNHDALLAAIRESLERSRLALDRELELRELHSRYALLTRRERQVMARVICGVLNKQTAIELGISEITVKAHRGRVMQKMKANSLPHLVRMAERLDLEYFVTPSSFLRVAV